MLTIHILEILHGMTSDGDMPVEQIHTSSKNGHVIAKSDHRGKYYISVLQAITGAVEPVTISMDLSIHKEKRGYAL